jgi:hypothetical protein
MFRLNVFSSYRTCQQTKRRLWLQLPRQSHGNKAQASVGLLTKVGYVDVVYTPTFHQLRDNMGEILQFVSGENLYFWFVLSLLFPEKWSSLSLFTDLERVAKKLWTLLNVCAKYAT